MMRTEEVIQDIKTNELDYEVNSDKFYLMYSSMVLILKRSSDVRMKLFAALLERYSKGQEFSMSKTLKEIIAEECFCKPRSFDSAFTSLIKDNVVVKLGALTYKINPRHVFEGKKAERDGALAIIRLHCKDC